MGDWAGCRAGRGGVPAVGNLCSHAMHTHTLRDAMVR